MANSSTNVAAPPHSSPPGDPHHDDGLKPMSLMGMINMCFGFFGIQFGWGLQMANMSAIYGRLGAKEDELPWLWLAAPLTGLIVQPIVGYYSDHTWSRLGRRRPYFLIGAIFATVALIAMPHSKTLLMAAVLLWVLDAAVNVTMEPFRAFVGDLLPQSQRRMGFAMQSLFIGAGAVISSALPWLFAKAGVSSEAAPGQIPQTVVMAFTVGAAVYLTAVLYTIVTTKEHPPADMQEFRRRRAAAIRPMRAAAARATRSTRCRAARAGAPRAFAVVPSCCCAGRTS
jgi:maltose/moltooligosaccharide transporter